MDNEESLIRILERLEQNQREMNKETLAKFEKIAKAFQNMGEQERKDRIKQASDQRRLRDTLRTPQEAQRQQQLNKEIQQETHSRSEANEALKKTTRTLTQSGSALIGMLNLTTENLVDFVGKMKALPLIGTLAASGIVGSLVKTAQDTADSFRTLTKSGVGMESLLKVNESAVKFGLSLKDYSDLVSENALAIQHSGMNVVTDWISEMQDANSGLRQLGMSTRDVATFMVDYLSISKKMGEGSLATVQAQELERQNAERLAKSLQEVSFQTGRNAEEIRKAFAKEIDTDSSRMLSIILGPEIAKQVGLIKTELNGAIPDFDKIIRGLVVGGPDEKYAGLFNSIAPEVVDALQSVLAGGDRSIFLNALRDFGANNASMAASAWQLDSIGGDAATQAGFYIGAVEYARNSTESNPDQIARSNQIADDMNLLSTTMYDVYMNIMTPLIQRLAEMEPGQIKQWAESIANLATTIGTAIGDFIADPEVGKKITETIDGAKNLINTLGQLATGFVTLSTAIGGMKLLNAARNLFGLGGAVAGGATAGGAKGLFGKLFGGATKLFGAYQIADSVIDTGKSIWDVSHGNEMSDEALGDIALTATGAVAGSFFGPGGTVAGAAIGGMAGDLFGEPVGKALKEVGKTGIAVFENIKNKVVEIWDGAVAAWNSTGENIATWWTDTKDGMQTGIRDFNEKVEDFVDGVGQGWNNGVEEWKTKVEDLWGTFTAGITTKWDETTTAVSDMIELISENSKPIFDAISGMIDGIFTGAKTFFADLEAFMRNPFGGWGQSDPARQEEMRNERLAELDRLIAEQQAEIDRITNGASLWDHMTGGLDNGKRNLEALQEEQRTLLNQINALEPTADRLTPSSIANFNAEEIAQLTGNMTDSEVLSLLTQSINEGNQRVVEMLAQSVVELRDINDATNAVKRQTNNNHPLL